MMIQAEMYLPALILIYAGIDTAGWLASTNPSEGVRSRFCRWVEHWLLPAKPLACTAFDLYGARCGILHTFTSDSDLSREGKARRICYVFGKSTVAGLDRKLASVRRTDCISLHLDDLFDAFRLALANYLEHALSDPVESGQLARKAERYFKAVTADEATQFEQPNA
jgi:hypothetical protein